MNEKLKAQLGQFQTALNGFFDSERLAKLTPDLRSKFDELKNSLDEGLKGLGPIDMVKGAQQAAWGLEDVLYSMNRLLELNAQANNQISELIGQQTATHSAPGAEDVESIISQRVASGELLTKENHTVLLGAAEETGKKAGRQEVEDRIAQEQATAALVQSRTERLTTLGLATPGESQLAILELPEAEFEVAVTTASERHTAHKDQLPQDSEAWPQLLYAAPENYSVLSAGLKSLTSQAAPAKPNGAPAPNPMAAGGAGGGTDDSKPSLAGRF